MPVQIEIAGRTFYEPRLRWKHGRAYIRFYHPDKQPTQREHALHTSDKMAAAQLFQQRRFEYLHGMLDSWEEKRVEGVTLEEALRDYLEHQDVRPSSLRCKQMRLEPFVRRHPGMMASGITKGIVEAYCYRSNLKVSTQQRYLYELRHFIDYCWRKGWIGPNPAEELQKTTPKRKKRVSRELTEYLSPAQVRKLVQTIEKDIEAKPRRAGRRVLINVILSAVATGLRRGEICNLRWEHVRLYDPPLETRFGGLLYGWLAVRNGEDGKTKTGDEDRVPVVPQAYELLRRMNKSAGESGYVFEAPRKPDRLYPWWVSDRFRYYRREAKLPKQIHFHSLRHTCASWLAESGVDLKVIQEVLRHSNIRQTMRYAHLMPEVVASKMVQAFEEIDMS